MLGALLAPDRDGALSGENMHVTGTMTITAPGAENQVAVVPLPLAQRLLHMDGRATELAVAVDDIDDASRVAASIQQRLGPDFEVHTWDRVAIFVNEILLRQEIVVNVIATIFMILMLLGVANTMLMSVLERTREIGTMMAVGVRRNTIIGLFLLEALALGALGGVLGSGAGTLFVLWLHGKGVQLYMPGQSVPFTIRPVVGPAYLALVVAIAAGGGMIFALYPAWRAGRLRPVEALAGQ
jgi:putative ABC transport system permease protein